MVAKPRTRVYGHGSPVTLVVPGLGATEGEARIPASGLRGSRVVLTLPGHGSAPDAPPDYWDYGRIAEDVLAVADEVAATRAVGVSLGAGALTRIAAERPERFDRLALLLPASLDRPREAPAMRALADAVDDADVDRLRTLVGAEFPRGADVGEHVEQRVSALLRLGDALRSLPRSTAVTDADALRAVSAEVLVVGATEDPRHPAGVAEDLAAAFPKGRLELVPSAAPMVTHRTRVRQLLTGFLSS